jgi:hypothetical protein
MTDALLEYHERGVTSDPALVSILLTRRINAFLLTGYGPWDIDQMDESWLDALDAVARGTAAYQAGMAKVASAQEHWRSEFRRRNPAFLH